MQGLLPVVFRNDAALLSMIRTAMSVTVLEAGMWCSLRHLTRRTGQKYNVVPPISRAVVNVRSLPGDTVESIVQHITAVVHTVVYAPYLAPGDMR